MKRIGKGEARVGPPSEVGDPVSVAKLDEEAAATRDGAGPWIDLIQIVSLKS